MLAGPAFPGSECKSHEYDGASSTHSNGICMRWRYLAALVVLCVLWWYAGRYRTLDTLPIQHGWSFSRFQLPCYFGAVLIFAAWAYDATHGKRARWKRAGRCAHCGYDLTGNVSGKCPECGTETNDMHITH